MRDIKSTPDTSHAANKAATKEMRELHYDKIKSALSVLKSANYEIIAKQAGFKDRNQASRRMKEMVGLGMIYRTDIKTATSSGRSAYNYSLVGQKELSVVEQVDQLIHNATASPVQQNLFD